MVDKIPNFKIFCNIFWISLFLGASFWVLDSLADSYLFDDHNFMDGLLSPDSKEIWIRSFVFFIFIVGGYSVQTMVEKMKKIFDLQLESEAKLKLLYEGTALIYIRLDEFGKIREANNGFCNLIGCTENELINTKLINLMSNPSKRLFMHDFDELKTNREMHGQEYELIRKNNDYAWVGFFGKSVFDSYNNFQTITCILHDISERKLAQKALAESEAKFKAVCESAVDAIMIMDSNGLIQFWNKAAENIFGYTEVEIIGQNLHKTLAPQEFHLDHLKAMEFFTKSGKGNAIGKTLELKGIRKNGHVFPLELSLSAVRLNKQWNAIGIIRDISVRKKREEKQAEMAQL
ncbi:MAG: PAS domain S-box protein [Candidatus Zixiibacteriota bacterium]